ncbi:MAG: YceI family protein [bacterium]|nr:YceI family protein [bacterium]
MVTRVIGSLLMLATLAASAFADTYYFGTQPKHTNITFTSETILETILGNVNAIQGSATLAEGQYSVKLDVPVDQMKTGIEMRDGHMKSEHWLDVAKYPNISFTAKSAKRLDGDKWEVNGDFTMHGITKTRTIVVEATPIPADKGVKMGAGQWMRFRTEFPVKLSDHQVKIAAQAEGKVNDEWKVKVMLYGTTEP